MSDAAFTNEPIDVSSIPTLDEDHFVGVDPKYLQVSLIGSAIFAIVVIVGCITVGVLLSSYKWIPYVAMASMLVLTALGAVLKVIEVRNIAYQARDHDLSYRLLDHCHGYHGNYQSLSRLNFL